MEYDYQSRIELDRNLSKKELVEVTQIINAAFCNRAGTIKNTSEDSYVFVFEGNEPEWGCLGLGNFTIRDNSFMNGKIVSWEWIDIDPEECVDLKKMYREFGYEL